MTGDEFRQRATWVLGTIATLVGIGTAAFNFRAYINWPALAEMMISALTIAQIALPALLGTYFRWLYPGPLGPAVARFFFVLSAASVWGLLTDLIPAIFVRIIRSLVFRGLVVSGCLILAASVLAYETSRRRNGTAR